MSEHPPTRGGGRFAPSPSGDLHVGNLRTALLAWLFARTSGRTFGMRIEDLDRVRAGAADRQLADLAALGLTWRSPVSWQSQRRPLYDAAVHRLIDAGLTYECFCTRREVLEAAVAPHGPPGTYPGTCRRLTDAERDERRQDRAPALRLRSEVATWTVLDRLAGPFTGVVDDFVLRRGDGLIAYNLAVVVDDGAQGVDQVVRGDDLLPSSPRQAYLADLLGLPAVEYAHVPLALNGQGQRLAKRDGAVTLAQLGQHGIGPSVVLSVLAASVGLAAVGEPVTVEQLAGRFDPDRLPREPWIVDPARIGD